MQSEHYIMDLNKGNEQKNKVVKKASGKLSDAFALPLGLEPRTL